jgi:uncharacterized BrkB/YihY/UPF0761 family membrane protein
VPSPDKQVQMDDGHENGPPGMTSSQGDVSVASLAATLDALATRPAADTRKQRALARAVAFAQRATSRRPFGEVAEVVWQTGRRDAAVAGSVLAAAIAYRIFILALPLGFFLVVALGAYSDAASADPSDVLDDVGVVGYFADSIAHASDEITGLSRVVALIGTGLLVLYETNVLMRTLRSVSALAWRIPIRALTRPVGPTLLFLLLSGVALLAGQAITPLRASIGGAPAIVLGLAALVLLPAYWLAVSVWLLPHAARRRVDLVPGALLFGGGLAILQVFFNLILLPWLDRKEETYGVLGVAAGLLLAFFLTGRLIELSASLNAVLTERRLRRG